MLAHRPYDRATADLTEQLVDSGQLTRVDPRELAAKAAYWKDKIRAEDGGLE